MASETKNQTDRNETDARAAAAEDSLFASLQAVHARENRAPSVTIKNTRAEIFAFLRDFSNYSLFFKDVREVRTESASEKSQPSVAHWTAGNESELPGKQEKWSTEITGETPDEMIAWRTLEGGAFAQNGVITLEDSSTGRGTVVRMKIIFDSQVGKTSAIFAKLLGQDPDSLAAVNLRRLKAYLETGEVPTIEGQSSGRDAASTKH